MTAPAHSYGILSLDESVAWLRNSSLRRIRKVATLLSKPFPSQLDADNEDTPTPTLRKGASLSGQLLLWIDEVANACLRDFSSPTT